MKFPEFKPYLKYGLFLLFALSLVGTAHADASQLIYYNWCEDAGNTIIDNSGYGNDGVNYGSTTFILPTGQVAGHFNGQSRITIPANEQLTSTDPNASIDPNITFGVFFCYNYSNPTNCTYLVSKGNDTCRISIDHTNSTIVYEICTDGYDISGYSECQIEPDEDYEAIVTYDGSHAQLYINGIASGKGVDYTATALDPSYNTDSWTIGSSPDNEYGLNGTVYAFYVYDRALNSSEVLDLYVNDIHSIRASNKPGGIALSWDDTGHIDTCYKYLSIFQKYNATCTMNVNKISNREIPTATLLSELDALHSAGWEIAAHGYNHTNSRLFLTNNTPAEWLDQEIFPNIIEITRYGYPVYSLAYPYSDRTTASDAILAPYFRTLRTGVPDVINDNVTQTPLAYYDWDDARLLYGVEIDEHTDTSLQSIEDGIDYAITTGNVLVLYGHIITPNVTEGVKYQTSTARLDAILNYTVQHGGAFYNLGDLGNSTWVQPARFSNVTAKFTVSEDTVLAGGSVTFTDYSVNQTTESLDFGDSSPVSNTANVTHTYAAPGTYEANLTVANDVSSHSARQTITVITPSAPIANFTSNLTNGFSPLSVAFTDASTGIPTSWSWDFGDGGTSTIKNPTYTYSTAGNYSVQLNVTNDKGSDYIQKVNYITVLSRPLSSNFTANVTSGAIPLTVQFSDTSEGNPTSWSWDFGDGNTSAIKNPMHTYFAAGNYAVTLEVSNTNGTDSKTTLITVFQKPEGNVSNVLPVADFSTNIKSGYAPLSVTFTDLSQNSTFRIWNFGDKNTSESKNPTHTYYSAGNYTVILRVSNTNGTDSKTAVINVLQKPEGNVSNVLPVADFSMSATGGYAPLSVTFTNLSQNATSISWDVNSDGIEDSSASSFTYEYAYAGTYTAKLTAKNENGTSEKTATIIVDRKSSGGSSGGSGGGGGGGSPEPAKNVEVKELSQVFITNGNRVKFDFPKNVTAIDYLSFDARKTVGKTTAIVEMLKNQSTLTQDEPQGEVYSYLNIWVGNGNYATEKNIENAIVCFKVKKSWIEDKSIDQSSIVLNRYSEKRWNKLPTTLLGEDNRYLYFTSETQGFSPFAITAEKIVIEMPSDNGNSEKQGNIESDIEKEQAGNASSSQKEKLSMPGFEMIYCILGLFGVFLHKKRLN